MKNLITLTLIILMASCQKDYYLEDLNAANTIIEQQNSIIADLQNTINELTANVAADQIIINNLTNDLNNSLATIDSLQIENAIYGATIDTLNTQINHYITTLGQINEDLNNTNQALTAALNDAEVKSSTIIELSQEIASLEAEIAAFEPEIITLIEYVHHYSTITVIEYVEVEVEAETEIEADHLEIEEETTPEITQFTGSTNGWTVNNGVLRVLVSEENFDAVMAHQTNRTYTLTNGTINKAATYYNANSQMHELRFHVTSGSTGGTGWWRNGTEITIIINE